MLQWRAPATAAPPTLELPLLNAQVARDAGLSGSAIQRLKLRQAHRDPVTFEAPTIEAPDYAVRDPTTRRINRGRLRRARRAQQRGSTVAAGALATTPSADGRASATLRSRRIAYARGRAHAALVLDTDGAAQGWCQYGGPEELSNIKHKREYDKDAPPLPDWRITCIFVDKKHRGQGIARAGLEGALDQIARLGGGLVEAIPEVTTGREAHGRFLFSATVELFEQYGFTRGRRVGKHACIVSKRVRPA